MFGLRIKSLMACVLAFASCAYADTVTAIFNWSDPSTLSPAYPAPTSTNQSGEYIGNVVFSNKGVTVKINDDNVKELSRKARFYFGYLTQCCEMRAYYESDIIVTAPEGMTVSQISFEGAKVGNEYLIPYDEKSSFSGQTWTAGVAAREAKFFVDVNINCTAMMVRCTGEAGVDDITADDTDTESQWFTLTGIQLNERPTAPGLYIQRKGAKAERVLIR